MKYYSLPFCRRRSGSALRPFGLLMLYLVSNSSKKAIKLCVFVVLLASFAPAQVNGAAEERDKGFGMIRSGNWASAEQLFDKALSLQPSDPLSKYGKAVAVFNLRRVDEADALLLAILDDKSVPSGVVVEALVLSAVIESVKGHNDAAVTKLSRAVGLAPKHFDANFSLARALFASGDLEGAIRYFRQAIAIRPDHGQARFFFATALERRGDDASAIAEYRELLRRDPRSFDGRLGLGILLIKTEGSSSAEGLRLLGEAVAMNPRNYEVQVSLGKAHVKNGAAAKAVEYLLSAAALNSGNPEPHYQLAIAYRRLGRKAEAEVQTEIVKQIHERRRRLSP